MRELDHPNLVSIYDFYQDDPKHFYMVLELMLGGELFDRIVQKVRGRFRLTVQTPCGLVWFGLV